MNDAVARADRVMDRAYRRFGWWLAPGFLVTVWAIGFVVPALSLILFARILGWTDDELLGLSGRWFLIICACTTLSVLHGVHACRPLRRFERGELDADQTWRAVVGLQSSFMKVNTGLALLGMVPGFLNIVQVEPVSAEVAGTFVLVFCGMTIYILVGAVFLFPHFLRPVLRAISQGIEGNSPPVSGFLLTNRLLFLVPGLGVSMAVFGACLGLSPGTGLSTAFTHIAVAAAVSVAAMTPVTILVVRAVKEPIEDLLEGTKRLRDGNYTVRVPELSSDELGDLARSFNEAMAGLADRQKLGRERVQLLDEVRASRARIVAASDASRRRIERNLHDGAQQSLVAVTLDLRLLEEAAPTMPTADLVSSIRQASDDVKNALDELRELARGLHPALLTTDGLAPALSQLAARAKLPVTVGATSERFAPEVESAAYFVAAEALANVAKYAHAAQARVSAKVAGGALTVEIDDDGIGGATLGSGTGLAGLADRVAALDGNLRIESPAGRGTSVIARIPVNGKAVGGASP